MFELHPFQREALAQLAKPRVHVALTAPTGSGKGVILEVLARNPEERLLVLTPLVALARQQRLRFLARGIPAARVRILSPESALLQARGVQAWQPTLIAVDEAHCLSEWGARFRPAYGKILEFIAATGGVRTIWMSATFPRPLFDLLRRALPGDWIQLGQFQSPPGLRTEFVRISPADRVERIHASIHSRTGPGLVFASTRKDVGRYAALFGGDRAVLPYHAGLSDEERRLVEGLLTRESGDADPKTSVVATNAFGMGMDFPQFGWAALTHAPFSLLGLMQTFGRVARGGRSGMAELFWSEEDFRFAGLLLGDSDSTSEGHTRLNVLRRYLEGTAGERHLIEATEFL
jgi:ATP-dependent DNA helicase RecQ